MKIPKITGNDPNKWPSYIMAGVIVFLGLSLLAFYLIDLRNIFGWRDALFALSPDYFYFNYHPFFFQHWGRNSGPAEILQWLFLGGSALLAAASAGRVRNNNRQLARFWGLMSVAFTLMLLEDAGNIRHTLMGYVQAIFDEPDQGWAGTIFELSYFSFLGGLPFYALLRYGWKNLRGYVRIKAYLVAGFAFYFLAGSLSFIGTAFSGLLDKDIYTLAGEKLYDLCLRLGDSGLGETWAQYEALNWNFPIGFYMVDGTLEEALELLGGGAFFGALLLFWMIWKSQTGAPDNNLKNNENNDKISIG